VPGMPDTQPPAVPAPPAATTIGSTTVALSWKPTSDNVGVAGYSLYRNGNTLLATSCCTLSFVDKNLTSGLTYNYTVAAFDAEGNVSPVSAPLVVTTVNINPPTAPANLMVVGATKNSVSLVWNPATDIGPIAGYRVLRGKTQTSLAVIANIANVTAFTDNAVGPNTTYFYKVEAFIASGLTGPPSNLASITTPAH